MTNHRDPVEEWLSQDVEVLPPPPGTFHRVRRRARRRKAMQAASIAAGIAVVVAAGVSVPALTGNLFGRANPASIGAAAPATMAPASLHATASPGVDFLPGPALPHAGHGPAVPAGFRPESVTFVGNHGGYLGAVLGQAPCRGVICTAMAGTGNYGGSWTKMGAPPAVPQRVSQVRFADPRDGWAFGPALYATHDGGATWRAINTHGGEVVDLAAVGDRAFALIQKGSSPRCAPSAPTCSGFALYSAAVTSDRWTAISGGSGSGWPVNAGDLQLTQQGGYLLGGSRIYAGPVTGQAWHAVRASAAPLCLTRPGRDYTRLLAPGRLTLYLACGLAADYHKLVLYASGNGGRSWQALGTGPVPAGEARSLAVSPAGRLVLAAGNGLYFSGSGRSWNLADGIAAGVGFRYVGMTTSRLGVAVPSSPSATQIFVTGDGGRTWRAHTISP
jgi:hypothetical protein